MLFVIIGHDGPNGARLRPTLRHAHLENLRPMVEAGKIVVASCVNAKPRASRAIAMLFALRSAPMKTGITTGT